MASTLGQQPISRSGSARSFNTTFGRPAATPSPRPQRHAFGTPQTPVGQGHGQPHSLGPHAGGSPPSPSPQQPQQPQQPQHGRQQVREIPDGTLIGLASVTNLRKKKF